MLCVEVRWIVIGEEHPDRNPKEHGDDRHDAYGAKIEATRAAMDAGASSIYEASFSADHVFVAVDVLLRELDGRWRLIEVKSSKSVKDEHLMDAAIQLYVLEQCGVRVSAVDIMHL